MCLEITAFFSSCQYCLPNPSGRKKIQPTNEGRLYFNVRADSEKMLLNTKIVTLAHFTDHVRCGTSIPIAKTGAVVDIAAFVKALFLAFHNMGIAAASAGNFFKGFVVKFFCTFAFCNHRICGSDTREFSLERRTALLSIFRYPKSNLFFRSCQYHLIPTAA